MPTVRQSLAALALLGGALATAPAAQAATLALEGDTLVLRSGATHDRVYLDDSYNPPDPAQVLRFDGNAVFTAVPDGCALREDTMVDCPLPARVRVELGAGNDGFGILNQVSADLVELVVDGGDGSDSLKGDHVTPRRETLLGGPGDDGIDGYGGDDDVRGGPGTDDVAGGAGSDRVLGEEGDDKVSGDHQAAPGADVIDGGPGSDLLSDYTQYGTDVHPPANVSLDGAANDGRPGEGDDVAGIERYIGYVNGEHVLTDGAEHWQQWSNVSGGGASTIRALGGDDKVVGEDAQETIDGGAGADLLEGGKGHDTLTGGPGRDTIFGDDTDSSCNTAYPESCVRYGNDVIDARDGELDNVDCGAGTDRVLADALDVVAPNCETVERAAPGAGGTPAGGSGTGPGAGPASSPRKRFSLVGAPRLATALRQGLTVRLTGARPGRSMVLAKRGARTVAKGVVTVGKSRTATVRLRFTAAARRSLARSRSVTLTVTGAGLRATLTVRR